MKGWRRKCRSWDCSAWRREGLGEFYQYLKRGSKEDGARLFSVVLSDKTRDHGQSWVFLLIVRMTEQWPTLSEEVVGSECLDTQKPSGHVLGIWLQMALLEQRVGPDDPPGVMSNLNHSVIL